MARVEIPITLINSTTGVPVSGASATVKVRSTSTNATVYAAETGSTTVTQPLSSNSAGRVEGWVERGAYKVSISGSGITSYDEQWDAAPAGDQTVDVSWLVDGSITAAKLDSTTQAALPTYYSSLPAGTSWTDGKRIVIPNATNDGYWSLMWSSSNGAWYSIGGAPSTVDARGLTASTTAQALNTAVIIGAGSDPLTITLPNKGTYLLESAATIDSSIGTAGNVGAVVGIGTTASDAESYMISHLHVTSAHIAQTYSQRYTRQFTTTSNAVSVYYRNRLTGQTSTALSGDLTITPIKLVP
jgi:hypothetical protein